MSLLNKRNALLGWVTWMVAKRTMKRKAHNVMSGTSAGGGGRKRFALPLVAAAVGGALLFWRRQRNDDPDEA